MDATMKSLPPAMRAEYRKLKASMDAEHQRLRVAAMARARQLADDMAHKLSFKAELCVTSSHAAMAVASW